MHTMMRSRPLALLALVLAGCGGVVADPPIPTAPASPVAPGKVDTSEAPATKQGTVSLESLPANLLAFASFSDGPPTPDGEGCRVERLRPAGSFRGDQAGDVHISYTANGTGQQRLTGRQRLALAWDPLTSRYTATEYGRSMTRLDVAGENVDVSVSGELVPGFQASVAASAEFDVTGLPPFDVTSKSEGLYQSMNASAESDLVLGWSHANNPVMRLELAGHSAFIQCRFSSPATSGVVPAAMMRELAADPARVPMNDTCPEDKPCLLGRLVGTNETHVRAGAYDVKVAHESWRLLAIVLER